MNSKSSIFVFYFFKLIFIIGSWIAIFNFDINHIDYSLFFITVLIYSLAIVFDLFPIVLKKDFMSVSKTAKLSWYISIVLLICNILIVFFSIFFSNWLVVIKINSTYVFQIKLETFVSIYDINPNLFTLKSFLTFVGFSSGFSIIVEYIVEIDKLSKLKQRKQRKPIKPTN